MTRQRQQDGSFSTARLSLGRLRWAACLLALAGAAVPGWAQSAQIDQTSPLPSGARNAFYRLFFTSSNTACPADWELDEVGGPPPGLGLNSDTGELSGTPSSTGTFNFTVIRRFGCAAGLSVSKAFSLTINAQFQVTTTSPLPATTVGGTVDFQFTATGGPGPYEWINSFGVPPGLSLSTSGRLTGTPTQAGTFSSYQIRVSSISRLPSGTIVSQAGPTIPTYSITVNTAPSITTSSLPDGTRGVSYTQALATQNGTSPFTWSATGLPSGLSINITTGVVSGTPTVAGSFTPDFTATDAAGVPATRSLALTIDPPPPAITTSSTLPPARQGQVYSLGFAASGGTGGPYTWARNTQFALPPGLAFRSDGHLYGLPTSTGTFTLQVMVSDSSSSSAFQSFSLTVQAAGPTPSPGSPLGVSRVGAGVLQRLGASGGTLPYSFAVTGGTVPPGTEVTTAGQLSGFTTQAGTFTFTVTVTDAAGVSGSATYSFVVEPNAPAISAPSLGSIFGANLRLNQSVNTPIPVITTGAGVQPVTFSVAGGTLPPGVSIGSGGNLEGTPRAIGQFPVVIRAVDASGARNAILYLLSVDTVSGAITNSYNAPDAVVGQPYSQQVPAENGTAPHLYRLIQFGFPTGLVLSSSGLLNGTPSVADFPVPRIQIIDANGLTATRFIILESTNAPTLSPTSILPLTAGVSQDQQLVASGGNGTYTISLVGTPPASVSLVSTGDPSSPILRFTNPPAGTLNFTVRVVSGSETLNQAYSVTVEPALVITTASLPGRVVGTNRSDSIVATGGTPPYVFAVETGSLPPGVSLNPATGVLSGAPTQAGTFNFGILVMDDRPETPRTARRSFSIQVVNPVTISPATLPNATAGQAYTQALTATGGTGTYTFSLTGTPPSGVAVNSTTGVLTVSNPSAGTLSFTVQAVSGPATGTRAYTLTVDAALTITTTSLQDRTQGVNTSETINVSGGTAPYSFAVTAGALPPGVSLNSTTGVVSGAPTQAGSFSFTITATDSRTPTAQTDSQAYTVTVLGGVTITTTSPLPSATAGTAYTQTLAASGGNGSFVWELVGTPPSGLSLNSTTGVLSLPNPVQGTLTFTARATSGGSSAQRTFTLVVEPPLAITTTSLPPRVTGSNTSDTITATGGTSPYSFAVTAGALPSGVSLNSTTGVLSGAPTQVGSFTFTIGVTDSRVGGARSAQQSYTVQVVAPLSLAPASLPNGQVGSAYSQTFSASGGQSPYSFSVVAGSLPAGLSLNSTSGAVTGTPTTAATSNFTVQARDSLAGGPLTTQRAYSITIAAPLLTLGPSAVEDGFTGAPYSATFTATGGTAPYTFSVSSGALPNGLTLSAAGSLTGTPTTAGSFSFRVTVTDSGTPAQEAFRDYTVEIIQGVRITMTSPLPSAVAGQAYTQTIAAQGGVSPYTFSLTGTPPTGLSINSTTGVLSLPNPTSGTLNFTVRVLDLEENFATRAFSLTVLDAVTISPATLPNATAGQTYTQALSATGGTGTYTFSLTGTPPSGVAVNSTTGVLTVSNPSAGTLSFTVQAVSGPATGTRAYTLMVDAALTITTSSLPTRVVGSATSDTIAATGGTSPYSFAVTAGALPSGVSLNSTTGAVSGAPTQAGSFSFTITATDSRTPTARTDSQAYTLQVLDTLTFSPATLPNGQVDAAYSQTFTAAGGQSPYRFTVLSGTLPAGLSLNSTSGVLSGTATTAGSSTFTVQVRDSLSSGPLTAQRAYTVVIAAAQLTLAPSTLNDGVADQPYSAAFTAAGGTPSYSFAVTSGSLPQGISLASTTGALSGTPTTAGNFSFRVTVTDSGSPTPQTASRDYTLAVLQGLSITTTSPLTSAVAGQAYTRTIAAQGGTAPYTFSLTGTPPAGLSISSTTGVLSLPNPTSGTLNFTVLVQDSAAGSATRAFALTVLDAVTISPATLPNATAGQTYTQALSATGGTGTYTFSLTGTPPAGVAVNSTTGVLTVSNPSAGTLSFTVQAVSGPATGTRAYTLTVDAALTITTTSLPPRVAGANTSDSIVAAGGTTPYAFAVTSGALPSGVSLNSTTGAVSGAPALAGSFSFTVTVTDGRTPTARTASQAFTLQVFDSLSFTPTTLPDGQQGTSYGQTLTAVGGQSPYRFTTVSGSLPQGLSLNSTTGALTGTPTATGPSSFTIQVADSTTPTPQTIQRAYSISITQAAPTILTGATLPAGRVGLVYSLGFQASGGTAPYTWFQSGGSLPPGLSISSGGHLYGVPTQAGSYTFTAFVNGGLAQREFTVSILAPGPLFSTSQPLVGPSTYGPTPLAVVNANESDEPIRIRVPVYGGTPPYTLTTTGTLPPGLSIGTGATLEGLLDGTGTFIFPLTVADSTGATDTRTFTVAANGSIGFRLNSTRTLLPSAVRGTPYTRSVTGVLNNPQPLFSVSLVSGALPPGVALTSTGVSGTPTALGLYSFILRIMDAVSQQGGVLAGFTLGVNEEPAPVPSPTSISTAIEGVPYSVSFTAPGSTPPLRFRAVGGALPQGLALSSTGTLAGTPTVGSADDYPFLLQTIEASGGTSFSPYPFEADPPELTFTTTALPRGTAGQRYDFTFAATGGVPPYAFFVVETSLPDSAYTLTNEGQLTLLAPVAGSYTLVVEVFDRNEDRDERSFTLNIDPVLSIAPTTLPSGVVGRAVSQQFTSTGGAPPYSFVRTGTLPPGLSLTSGGLLSGTYTTAGTFPFTVTAVDTAGRMAPASFSVQVFPALTLTLPTFPAGVVGQPYGAALTAAGGNGTYQFSVVSGTLPVGLALNSTTGAIAGTPTTPGTSNFRVRLNDTTNLQPVERDASITVQSGVTITTASPLPPGAVGFFQPVTFAASGGLGSFTFAVTAGALPGGLTLTSGGVLSGTPTAAGTFNFTVTATSGGSDSKAFQVVINPALTLAPAPGELGPLSQGGAFTLDFTSTGGVGTPTFTASGGSLPPGLTLSSTGRLSGTPTSAGDFSFSIQVTAGASVTQAYTLRVNTAPAFLTGATLPTAVRLSPYSVTLQGTGGTTPYTFTATTALPSGLTLSTTGVLSGTPSAPASTLSLTARLTDQAGATATRTFTLELVDTLTISTATLPGGRVGVSYSQTIQAAGGRAPYTFTLASGALPAGLALSSGGLVSGTPTQAGSFAVTIQVADSQSPAATATRAFTVAVEPPVLTFLTQAATPATATVAYSFQFEGAGGTGPYLFAVDPNTPLPEGLTLSSTGLLSGTPTTAGLSNVRIVLRDSGTPAQEVTVAFGISIDLAPLRFTNTATLPPARAGQPYNAQLVVSGGQPPLRFQVSGGTLPPGITLSSTGLLAGTPNTPGSFTFTVSVQDQGGTPPLAGPDESVASEVSTDVRLQQSGGTPRTASQQFTIVVAPPFLVVSASFAEATAGQPYAGSQVLVTGGTPPYSFALVGGSLPPGLSLSATGQLVGTPSQTGSFLFDLRVSDSGGQVVTVSRSLGVGVAPAPPIMLSGTLQDAFVEEAYEARLAASGGRGGPYVFSGGDGLPRGLALSSDGVVRGTPVDAGPYRVGVTVSDGAGTANFLLTLIVQPERLTLLNVDLANGLVGRGYAGGLTVRGGEAPLVFALAGGSLPPGLTLSGGGSISGAPTTPGEYSFTVLVTDRSNRTARRSYAITVIPPVLLSGGGLVEVQANAAVEVLFNASGGRPPYTFTTSGELPPGTTFTNGRLTGTATTPGSYVFTVEVADGLDQRAQRSATVTVVGVVTLRLGTVPTDLAADDAFSLAATTTGGTAPYTYRVSGGSLPPGTSLNSTNGTVSGTVTEAGTFGFTIEARDTTGRTSQANTQVVVGPRLTLSGTGPASLTLNAQTAASFTASGGTAPYQFSQSGLPAGLALSSAGQLTGAPTASGTFPVTVTVTDARSRQASTSFTLAVVLPPLPPPSVLVSAITVTPGQQPTLGVRLASAFPATVTGEVELTFLADGPGNLNDPAVAFMSGGRIASFTIDANSTEARFGALTALPIQTGTVAGTITLTLRRLTADGRDVTPTPPPTQTVTIPRQVPMLQDSFFTVGSGTLTVVVTGITSTRDLERGVFRFFGTGVPEQEITVPLGDQFRAYFADPANARFGGMFTLRVPFTIQGNAQAITSVRVVLRNSVGDSTAAEARLR